MSKKSKELKITSILDHINDQSFFTKHKNNIITLCKDPEIIEIIEERVTEGKRYSIIKLIDRLKLKIDDELFLNFFIHPENINLQIYYMLFTLYTKELISLETLNKIREKFINMKEYKQKIKNAEARCILRRIEMDRYIMKKERAQNEKMKSYEEHVVAMYKNEVVVSRNDFINLCGVNMSPKITYLVDLTEFFNLNTNYANENAIFRKIGYFSKKYFSEPELHDFYFSTVDTTLFKNTQTKKHKIADYEKNLEYWRDYLIENFNYCIKNNMSNDSIHKMNVRYKFKYANLRKAVKLLIEKGYKIYFISEVSLKYFFSELLVFGCDYIDVSNLVSYRSHRVGDVCLEIKNKEDSDQIFLFGCRTKIEKDYLHLITSVEKLNELAIKAIKL